MTRRMALPVSCSNCMNFKHITGIAAPKSTPTFSLSQLRQLDNLIDKLKSIKGEEIKNLDVQKYSNTEINIKINELSSQLHEGLNEDKLYKSKIDGSGILIDIVA